MGDFELRPQPKTAHRKLVLGAAAVVSMAAFVVGPQLFAPAAGMPSPSGAQLPFFVGLAAVEAAALGLAIAFAALGGGNVRRLFSSRRRAVTVHAVLVWTLASWWLHDGLHMANGTNLGGLLLIEYAFHVTLIAAAAVVIWALTAEARGRGQ